MGQYFIMVNLDKKQFLDPHELDCGAKLSEIAFSKDRVASALILLLAQGGASGAIEKHELIGSWAGDRIVVAGDYGDSGTFLPPEPEEEFTGGFPSRPDSVNLYNYAIENYENISKQMREVVARK